MDFTSSNKDFTTHNVLVASPFFREDSPNPDYRTNANHPCDPTTYGGFIGGTLDLDLLQEGLGVGKSSPLKKKGKVVKSQGGGVSLVVEEDIGVDQILDLSSKTMVC